MLLFYYWPSFCLSVFPATYAVFQKLYILLYWRVACTEAAYHKPFAGLLCIFIIICMYVCFKHKDINWIELNWITNTKTPSDITVCLYLFISRLYLFAFYLHTFIFTKRVWFWVHKISNRSDMWPMCKDSGQVATSFTTSYLTHEHAVRYLALSSIAFNYFK